MNELYIHVYEDRQGRPFTESAQTTFLESLQDLDDWHDARIALVGVNYVTTLIKRAPQGSEEGYQLEERDRMDALADFRHEIQAERADNRKLANYRPGGWL